MLYQAVLVFILSETPFFAQLEIVSRWHWFLFKKDRAYRDPYGHNV